MQIRSEYYVTVNHCLVRFRQPHFRPVLSCLSASLDLYVMDKSNLAAKILQIFYTVFLFSGYDWQRRLAYVVNNIEKVVDFTPVAWKVVEQLFMLDQTLF